ncbi:MAG: aspartate carbamoyltransferase [Phycisphaerae bacterium]|nr:aspartate carbamoyltransferase [Phycisphaerae bacterium]
MAGGWSHRHLLDLQSLSPDELRAILFLARDYAPIADRADAHSDELRGKVVANLFFEDSTRTRVSFSVAARRLSADVVDLMGPGSSASKGESIGDTALNIAALGVDLIVVRHKASGAAANLANIVTCGVVNAGDGRHEHPTQGLLDTYTLAEAAGRLDTFDMSGLTMAIVGDLATSRVARSNIAALTKLGARVICVGPPGLCPRSLRTLGAADGSCEVSHDLDAVIAHADAVNVLRIQFERHAPGVPAAEAAAAARSGESPGPARTGGAVSSGREYRELYGLTAERAARMKPAAVVMHPGPINKGLEMDASVADGARSVILRQVSRGVAVRMAVLRLCAAAATA